MTRRVTARVTGAPPTLRLMNDVLSKLKVVSLAWGKVSRVQYCSSEFSRSASRCCLRTRRDGASAHYTRDSRELHSS